MATWNWDPDDVEEPTDEELTAIEEDPVDTSGWDEEPDEE